MDQSSYTVADLLTDDSFVAYVRGTDPAAVRLWEGRLRRQPQHGAVIGEAATLIRVMALPSAPLPRAVVEEQVQQLRARLTTARVQPVAASKAAGQARFWQRLAASLLLLLVPAVLGWWLLNKPAEMLTCQTLAGKSAVVLLPDSSAVFLSGNSTLRYRKNWRGGAARQVWLEGEAFFHVQPKQVPGGLKFQVHTGQAVVEVLGTRFTVWNRNKKTGVVLSSGKVKVNPEKGNQQQAVFLEPGEMVEFRPGSRQPRKSRVALKAHPAQQENRIAFQDASLQLIALVVKEYYGLQVKLQDSTLADLRISGTLPTNNEKSFFKALALILELEISHGKDNVVILKRSHSY